MLHRAFEMYARISNEAIRVNQCEDGGFLTRKSEVVAITLALRIV